MTPNHIEIFIHYFVSPSDVAHPRRGSPAVFEAIWDLRNAGILDPIDEDLDMYRVTDKGRAWMAMLLGTPMPQLVWVDASGKVVR
jgi:hypothetical protein